MAQAIETIDVNVPVSVAYNQWTQFESFPKFLDEVESITQTTPTLTVWKVKVGPVEKTFEAEITEQHPDERVAWTTEDGTHQSGVVTFHRIDDDTTRVTLQLDHDPQGVVEKVGSTLGVDNHAIKKDLANFKEYIEAKGSPDGAWRGDVQA